MMTKSLQNFIDTYQGMTAKSLDRLATIYSKEITFIDPAHQIQGIDQLTDYFSSLYQNIDTLSFQFAHHLCGESECYVQWEMTLSHPRLNRGEKINVPGVSFLRFTDSGKVIFHRDYFDLGAMLYEQLPLFGKIISFIKRRLGS